MTYFSDREKTTAIEQLTECITIDIWNGIAIIINSLIANNNLAKDFRNTQKSNSKQLDKTTNYPTERY